MKIPAGNTMIVGDSGNRQTKGINSYQGTTTIGDGAVLIQGSDGALGNAEGDELEKPENVPFGLPGSFSSKEQLNIS